LIDLVRVTFNIMCVTHASIRVKLDLSYVIWRIVVRT